MRRALIAALLVTLACKAERSADSIAGIAAASDETALASAPASAYPVATRSATAAPASTRMIIRNASVSVVVKDAAEAMGKVTALVESVGGYVAETRQWKEREQVKATATLRVPAKHLTATLAAIRRVSLRTESEAISSQDVSQEYVDLEAQLRNMRAAETELLALLRTVRERTGKAGEVLEIYNEVTKVRGEIERTQGRIQYLAQMSAFSTITAELIPDVLAAPVVEAGWQPAVTVKAASRALVNSLKNVVDVLIWITLYILPMGLLFAALAFAIRQVWFRVQRTGIRRAG